MKLVAGLVGRGWALILLAAPATGCCETLADAVTLAYRNNPTLQGARAQVRELDENYVSAAAGLRPTIQAQAIQQYNDVRSGKAEIAASSEFGSAPVTQTMTNNLTGQIVVTAPVFTGGRVTAQIRQARSQIASGREGLRVQEGDLMLNVIAAYVAVRRDLQIVDVRAQALTQFVHQYDEAIARRAAGDATLTDVAQAHAQLLAERANFADAQQQLQASRAAYTALVGRNPGELAPEPALPNLPATVDQAFEICETNNPDLRQSILTEQASRAEITAARSQFKPTLSIQGSYGYSGTGVPLNAVNLDRDLVVEAVVTQPIFTGGLNGSNVRRALEQNNSDRFAVEATRRSVVENVANGWNALLTARSDIETQKQQALAANQALEGMQEEYRAGQRSTFEVLYAAQMYRDAQISELTARYNYYTAQSLVLRYIGHLEIADLTLDTPHYDPVQNFRAVSHNGMTPLDPIGRLLDSLAAIPETLRPLSAPGPDGDPKFALPTAPVPANAAAAFNSPVQPFQAAQ